MDQQSTEFGDLLFEVRNGIGRATFNRPQARNAFTFEMYERLAQICEQADNERSIKALVLQGSGDKAFASGTDINQFRAFKTPEHAIEYESRLDRVLTTLEQCRVPTIAAINATLRNYQFDIFSTTFNFGGLPHEEVKRSTDSSSSATSSTGARASEARPLNSRWRRVAPAWASSPATGTTACTRARTRPSSP